MILSLAFKILVLSYPYSPLTIIFLWVKDNRIFKNSTIYGIILEGSMESKTLYQEFIVGIIQVNILYVWAHGQKLTFMAGL